jgi:hypothetical protein
MLGSLRFTRKSMHQSSEEHSRSASVPLNDDKGQAAGAGGLLPPDRERHRNRPADIVDTTRARIMRRWRPMLLDHSFLAT